MAIYTPRIFISDAGDRVHALLTLHCLLQIIASILLKWSSFKAHAIRLYYSLFSYFQVSLVHWKISNWLTSTLPLTLVIFLGDLNSYIDDPDETLVCLFLISSLLVALSITHSHILTLNLVIYNNYTTSKTSIPNILAWWQLSIFPSHSLFSSFFPKSLQPKMASHWLYHHSLLKPLTLSPGLDSVVHHQSNTPLYPSPLLSFLSLPPISLLFFIEKLLRRLGYSLSTSSHSFLNWVQTDFCHHTNKMAPVKFYHNLHIPKIQIRLSSHFI